ncbi:hypothetical protein SAMN05720470_10438 [Fibrobacter sp. UWOV1]|uniref:hypothetical protein n=1 Tax=Fibrobacter sp. UWOV1 TaxID=1896215 RepID=UPI0009105C4B|nr:hypothetical protein [Fibrobacter sp. UWOV1]SHL01444.1 hypothetical protein SAMN05720470_10438 [Fibrobacter sp. UWOV1]
MKKILLSIFFFSISSFALSLEQVRADLKVFSIAQDSVEMSLRTMVYSSAGKQTISVYMVKKGSSKIYTEIQSSLMSQRSVINGSRMKVIDLKTNKIQVLPYNGDPLDADKYTRFNPLERGNWQEPVFVSENLYKISGAKGVLYYDSKKKRIEKIEFDGVDKFVLTEFTYDAENNLKTMTVSVKANGVDTKVVTEVLALRSSKKFPDKLFEF